MTPSSLPVRAVVALLVVQLLFGLHPVAAKLAFPAFGPGGVSLARVVGAALVFQTVRLVRREPGLPWRDDDRRRASSAGRHPPIAHGRHVLRASLAR